MRPPTFSLLGKITVLVVLAVSLIVVIMGGDGSAGTNPAFEAWRR